MENLEEGQVLEGTVQRLASFGAFVDIGGVDGLVHISQLSHEHVEKVSDVLKEGEKVNVKVLSSRSGLQNEFHCPLKKLYLDLGKGLKRKPLKDLNLKVQ